MCEDEALCEVMKDIGNTQCVEDTLLSSCERSVCALYGKPGQSVDDLRYQYFCNRRTQSHQLPPTADALRKHVIRANYQAYIWKHSLEPQLSVSNPGGNGWLIQEGVLLIDWMSLPPVPSAVMELLSCACNGGCDGNICTCRSSDLACTDACKCVNCVNTTDITIYTSDDSEDDD